MIQNIIATDIFQVLYAGFMAIFFMIAGFRLISGVLAIDISNELREKNAAVGMVVMGMFICVGLAVGLAVGLHSINPESTLMIPFVSRLKPVDEPYRRSCLKIVADC